MAEFKNWILGLGTLCRVQLVRTALVCLHTAYSSTHPLLQNSASSTPPVPFLPDLAALSPPSHHIPFLRPSRSRIPLPDASNMPCLDAGASAWHHLFHCIAQIIAVKRRPLAFLLLPLPQVRSMLPSLPPSTSESPDLGLCRWIATVEHNHSSTMSFSWVQDISLDVSASACLVVERCDVSAWVSARPPVSMSMSSQSQNACSGPG